VIGTDLNLADKILRKGNLVAIPTETVYGLAANALNENAVLKIFETKQRPHFDPLIVHASKKHINDYRFDIPKKAQILTDKFWPGPLTILISKPDSIPDIVTSGLSSIGLRMPKHPLTESLLKKLDFPLAAPSANPFSYVSPTSAKHVDLQLGNKIDYILDGGICTVGIESTIVSFMDEEQPTVLRLGGLDINDIEESIGTVRMAINAHSNPKAPGQLDKHYATSRKMSLHISYEGLNEIDLSKSALIGLKIPDSLEIGLSLELSNVGDLNMAAHNLFAHLREADLADVEEIHVVMVPEKGLGPAINDRLRRAAH